MKPTISIVVTAYNVKKYLPTCLDSIMNQSVVPDEVIVIDDGSTDETGLIADEYARIYAIVKTMHTENSGVSRARNLGLQEVTSDYVWFVDGDDYIEVNAIEILKNNIDLDCDKIILFEPVLFNEKHSWAIDPYSQICKELRTVWYHENPEFVYCNSCCFKIFSVEFLIRNDLSFSVDIWMCEDHLFSAQAYLAAKIVKIIPYKLYWYRQNNATSSCNIVKLSFFNDRLIVIQSLTKILPDNIKREYYKKFIEYDLFIRIMTELVRIRGKKNRITAFQLMREILESIPQHVDGSVDGKIKRIILHAIRNNKFCVVFLYALYKSIGYPREKIRVFSKIKKKFKKIIFRRFNKCKKLMFHLLYSAFSLLPLIKNKVSFTVDSVYGLTFYEPFYRTISANSDFFVVQGKINSSLLLWLCAYYHYATSKVIFLSDYSYSNDIRPRKGQLVMQLWHAGGAFKKFCFDVDGHGFFDCHYTHFITSSPAVVKHYASAFKLTPDKALSFGTIKSDVFFDKIKNIDAIKKEWQLNFPQSYGKKFILYAPTFRDNITHAVTNNNFPIDFDKFNEHFQNQYVLIIRLHPNFVKSDLNQLKFEGYNNIVDVSSYSYFDVLACADVLITDYSSIIFDFAFFKKPIIFYPYDIRYYYSVRSFYEPYTSFVPGPICYTQDELLQKLAETPEQYSKQVAALWDKYMSSCDGNTCEKIINFIKAN